MRRVPARAGFPVLGLLLAIGCGHDVKPTAGFEDPASIPLCCVTEPSAACCAFDAFPFSGGVQLSWNTEDGVFAFIDGWHIYRAEGSTTPAPEDYRRITAGPVIERTLIDAAVSDGEEYWYRLTALSPSGIESLPTPAVRVRVDRTPPAPPTGLVAEATPIRVRLTWDPAPEPDLWRYNVSREPALDPTVFFQVELPEFFDTLVEPDSTYRYWVTAVDLGLNESAPSESVSVTVPPP